jgi:ABC-type sugar transport system ATPase subunit
VPEPLLRTESVSKRFGPVVALDGVSIDLLPGEVHALIGENGAGKSTLMKILSGVERPDAGRIVLRGEPVELRSPAEAQARGIAMIHQELNLVGDLSVADNIFLGREHVGRSRLIRGRATRRAAGEVLARVGCDLPPGTRVSSLSIAERQLVEIAKAVSLDASVLIMDEPTAVLGGPEVAALFALVRRLTAAGAAVVYISHLLPEVLAIANRVTVLRDGRVVDTLTREAAVATGEHGLAGRMVGRPMASHFPPRDPVPVDAPVALDVVEVSVPGRVSAASLSVRKGEVLGLAGLVGAGRTELAEAICGLRRRGGGSVAITGQTLPAGSVRRAMAAGLAYLSEDRKATGLLTSMSITANMTLPTLQRYGRVLIGKRREAAAARQRVADLAIKVRRVGDPASSLSGGNQQKVALAKWLEAAPTVLVLDEPTRGVDVGAKEQIYQLIQRLTRQGMACILISSELNEVLALSHRVAVMRAGQLVATLDAADATEEAVMRLASGAMPAATLVTPDHP